MPRCVVLSVLLAVMTLASAAARADDWGAVSVSPDGVFSATANRSSQGSALDYVRKECSGLAAEKCIERSVRNAESAVAWYCAAEGKQSFAIITSGYDYADFDDHMPAIRREAGSVGYKADQCQPLVFVNGREAQKF